MRFLGMIIGDESGRRGRARIIVASLHLEFPEDDEQFIEVFRRWNDDLPAHVLGTAYWSHAFRDGRWLDARQGYRAHINGHAFYVEFINHAWYILEKHEDDFVTKPSLRIVRENSYGLGWWNEDDADNPDRLLPATVPEPVIGGGPQEEDHLEYIDEDVIVADPITELTTTFRRLTPIPADLALIEEDAEPQQTLKELTQAVIATYIPPVNSFNTYALPAVLAVPTTVPAMAATPLTCNIPPDVLLVVLYKANRAT
ncbi:hypothetical protein EDB89DRAFT_2084198 [Lactarius sanguifluus]|nr:hypothetical protein EDB89DRAFT_2084198 [Lactarius sanguifluus]